MKSKIFCPVCQVSFVHKEEIDKGKIVTCLVCGAILEITETTPEISASRPVMEPESEIRERVDNFAKLKGYTFSAEKEELIQGLLEKHERFGDFYCPCRFDNIPENVCPCLETRKNQVKKEGKCL